MLLALLLGLTACGGPLDDLSSPWETPGKAEPPSEHAYSADELQRYRVSLAGLSIDQSWLETQEPRPNNPRFEITMRSFPPGQNPYTQYGFDSGRMWQLVYRQQGLTFAPSTSAPSRDVPRHRLTGSDYELDPTGKPQLLRPKGPRRFWFKVIYCPTAWCLLGQVFVDSCVAQVRRDQLPGAGATKLIPLTCGTSDFAVTDYLSSIKLRIQHLPQTD
ncbi:MAG: hypothetical protein H6707_18955 [Deltaproteobacteria bacterium]|nr:hypothetical protein [Deltaproteobacteria bacterium]